VTAVLDAYPDWQIPSQVRTVIPSADRQKATVKVRISFLKLDPRILPDMGVKVTFLGEENRKAHSSAGSEAGVLVPESAVREDNGQKIVFLLKDNHAERRAVTLGSARGGEAEIIGGLAPGDAVIVKGPPGLRDGQNVEVRK
jgi:RND family efflux transporter MFP subunit